MAALAGTIALGAGTATLGHAETGRKEAAALEAMATADLTLGDAIRAAEAHATGRVIEAEFKVKKDGARYEVTLLDGATETELRIDPATGAILRSKTEAASEGPQELAAIAAAPMTLMQAIAQAEARGGRVLSAEYDHEDGVLVIELKVADAAGRVSETLIAVATGETMPGVPEDGEENRDG